MKTLIGWAYVICGVLLWLFVAPMLVSARDTWSVILGVLLLLGYLIWTWHFVVVRLFRFIKGKV